MLHAISNFFYNIFNPTKPTETTTTTKKPTTTTTTKKPKTTTTTTTTKKKSKGKTTQSLFSSSSREDADEYRKKAKRCREKADNWHQEFIQKIQLPKNSQQRSRVNELKEKRDKWHKKARTYDANAAAIYYSINNANKNKDLVDLHDLYVKEAISYADKAIEQAMQLNFPQMVIIYGRGNNSVDGAVKLKPAVLELVQKYKLKCTPGVPNDGCVTIVFATSGESYTESSEGANNCTIL